MDGPPKAERELSMNIVFIITRGDAVGGATIHVRDTARGLLDLGHRVLVLVGGTGDVLDEFAKWGIPYRSLRWLTRPIQPAMDAAAFFEIVKRLREIKPDLVCAHTAKAGLLGRIAAKSLGIPALYTPHGWAISNRVSPASGWLFRMLERVAGPLSSGVINVSEAERTLARHYHVAPEKKLAMIYNGVRDVELHLRANAAATPPHIVMVARMEPPKDPETLLRAMTSLVDLPWTLEFLGSGEKSQETQALSAQLGLGTRVTFTEGGTDVAQRLAESQIFALSSRSEGFPMSILEAMRAGLPVVGSDVGGVREAVTDGETGMVVPPGDAHALAGALRRIIADPLLRQRMGHAGRRRYELNFTFERMLAETLHLYDSVLTRRVKPALVKEASGGH